MCPTDGYRNYIESVLLNNPNGVQQNMLDVGVLPLGVLEGDLTEEELKDVLYQASLESKNPGKLIASVLDVNIIPTGPFATELYECEDIGFNAQTLGRELNQLGKEEMSSPSSRKYQSMQWNFGGSAGITWMDIICPLGIFALGLLIIYLIKKIFK